jgi:hypothetical protein
VDSYVISSFPALTYSSPAAICGRAAQSQRRFFIQKFSGRGLFSLFSQGVQLKNLS